MLELAAVALSSIVAASPSGDQVMTVTAAMPDAAMAVGQAYSIRLEVEVAEPWASDAAGMPKPLLQIDVPTCIRLAGRVLEGRELARNEFLQAPYERLVDVGTTAIEFTLVAEPRTEERVGLNVVAYLGSEGEEDRQRFVRRRVELPIRAGVSATSTETASESSWTSGGTVHVGERAPAFELPRADGSVVALKELLARGNVIVTTYRAFWWPFCARQLVQLQGMYDEFTKRSTAVVAVAQEDRDLESHGTFRERFEPGPRFEIVADIGREQTERYDRTTTYLISSDGIVRQVFPNLIRFRASWRAILNEMDRLDLD